MRILLLVIFAALAFCHPTQALGNRMYDIMHGMLEGLGIGEDWVKLEHCLQNYQKENDIFMEHVNEALAHLLALKFKELKKGFEILLAAVKELMLAVMPCITNQKAINKLIDRISNANIMQIVMSILLKPAEFSEAISKAVSCFSKSDFYCGGKSLGQVLKILFP